MIPFWKESILFYSYNSFEIGNVSILIPLQV